jgi:hypothetical protein
MSPQRKRGRRSGSWKPPRDRREVVVAVLASLAVIVVTASLVWFLRPNRDSGSTSTNDTVATTTTEAGATTTTPAGVATTVPTIAPVTTAAP